VPIPWQTVYVLICIFLAAVCESTFGFGSALLAMPLMALVLDLRVASPLMAMIAIVLGVAVLSRSWRHVQVHGIWRLILGSLPGIWLGVLLLKNPHQDVMKLVLALIIIAFPLYRLLGPALPLVRPEWPGYIFGFLAGVLGGAFNTAGPPVVIYASLKRWNPLEFRASLQGFFLVSGLFVNFSYWRSGYWTPEVWKMAAGCVPVALLAVVLGSWLHHRIPASRFHHIIHVILMAIGLSLLVGTIHAMLK
jgi:uncharacterized protein